MPIPESQLTLANFALVLGIILTIVLIINGLLEMPIKLRALWRLRKK